MIDAQPGPVVVEVVQARRRACSTPHRSTWAGMSTPRMLPLGQRLRHQFADRGEQMGVPSSGKRMNTVEVRCAAYGVRLSDGPAGKAKPCRTNHSRQCERLTCRRGESSGAT